MRPSLAHAAALGLIKPAAQPRDFRFLLEELRDHARVARRRGSHQRSRSEVLEVLEDLEELRDHARVETFRDLDYGENTSKWRELSTRC